MKLSLSLISFLAVAGVGAFAPYRATPSHLAPTSSSSSTSLNQFGKLGFDASNLYYTPEEEQAIQTQNKISAYLIELRSKRENKNTVLRSNLGKTVLISGFEPTDQSASEVLDFLNDEDSPHFGFSKIVVIAPDLKVAKKRLIGRNARYTGLLDKLDFIEGESSSSIPTVEQLADVSSWISHVGGGDNMMSQLASIADVAEKAVGVKNVAILISGANGVGVDAIKEAEDMLKSKATTFAYTLLIVPEWNNEPEALCAYGIANASDLDSAPFKEGETFSREESLRILTECLAIDQAAGKCVVANAAKETNSLENMLIQSMREIGFKRIEEVEHMVTVGAKGYTGMIAERESGSAWEMAPEPSDEEKAGWAKTKEEQDEINRQKQLEIRKQNDLKKMATEWAQREYLRKQLKFHVNLSEEEFIEVIWDRAMFEADLKYRTMQGQAVNESEERKKFKEAQERKKLEAYKKEQERWKKLQMEDLEPAEEKKPINFSRF